MYRQQHRVINPSHIVDFLILDKGFPRSVQHSLRQAELSLYEISGRSIIAGYSNSAEKELSKLRIDIAFTEVQDIFDIGLHEYLDSFQTRNNKVSKAIYQSYFDLKPVEA